ncbi:MAG: trypsin-like peptidase domain-containing protein [Eubacteriaceae bacterium]|nr:trypsin-like peptidase domain-containing protein [Eubacteriaceae bacterium]
MDEWNSGFEPNNNNDSIQSQEREEEPVFDTTYREIYTPPQQKKEPKYVTRKAFVLTLILCMIFTSALTAGGIVLLSNNGVISPGKTISATNYTLQGATGSEKSIEEIIAMNENAVVEIRTESVSQDIWLRNYVTEGAGSGVIIDSKGYIITNNHVVSGANKITVTLKDGSDYEASVVGTDSNNDIAVLKISGGTFTAATYGDSDKLTVGDMVVAIGNPLGQLGGTATQGIISALDRKITIDNKELSLLQTDASINPGNSGGGLFNQYGQLVGVVVAKSSGSDVEGLGFAIPVNTAAEVAKSIIENGDVVSERAIIGLEVIDIPDIESALQYDVKMTGLYVHKVTSTQAKKAGFKEGDLIYYFEDAKIDSSDDLSSALSKHKAGDTVTVTVIRDNETFKLKVVLQKA